jgi:dihydrofolate synthase/folylpolyglutamate synthase
MITMLRIETFSEASKLLAKFIPPDRPTSYTLDRMEQLMDYLGNPQNRLSVIHIAGTSGKTSTSYYIAALLHATGKTVGLSVSPHIDTIAERAQIDLRPLEESDYCEQLGIFLELIEKSGIQPSYFEVLVAFMYWLFEKRGVDYAVVEVGLGGLLDGTNVVGRSDKICVITDIGFDHTEILGNTLQEIATQKGGIVLEGNQVFMHSQPREVMETIGDICTQRSAHLTVVDDDLSMLNVHQYEMLPTFQKRNISLAYSTVKHALGSDYDHTLLTRALNDSIATYIPARMEEATWHKKTVIMDGSHNPQKIGALVKAIENKYSDRSVCLVVSFGENKAISLDENLRQLHSISSTIVITQFSLGQDEPRQPIDPRVIEIAAKQQSFETVLVEPDPDAALDVAARQSTDIILITGSLYLLNHIRPIVLG